ncbi:NAD-dependent epimerase/dehydratase family protein [Bacillus mangrovi]|uniref:NAD-dependent epimerase/dehydratase family protein n=1 Tax=Metabacillus mangrovi TaxID=1491830 RepID=A0A7X2V4Z6_9BACI|nr:NAD-dependent epimerase/dehydratase family protein [Metabacillus mangrovi]MTH53656.1 NAD-dependent epimerase/dehydratase family protein [Metabacillus mangrovi]
MNKKIVLVTGGTGYVASWLVKELLEDGHEVRITVRDKGRTAGYEHLLDAERNAEGTLHVFEANLLREGSFDQAADGSEYVFHTASPFFISGFRDAKKDLIKPALEGTRNVLSSVNKSESVRRVVLTSSAVAIFGDNADMEGKPAFTERDWNTTSSPDHQPYSYSKTAAEKEAWRIAGEQDRWDLVTINPTFILGPSLAKRTDSTSISTILDLVKGKYKTGVPKLINGIVDVRDAAKAHKRAAFLNTASGRYLISNEEASLLQMAKVIGEAAPGRFRLPKIEIPKLIMWLLAPKIGFTRRYVSRNIGITAHFDNSKSIRELDMDYRSLRTTLNDQVAQMEKDGLIR